MEETKRGGPEQIKKRRITLDQNHQTNFAQPPPTSSFKVMVRGKLQLVPQAQWTHDGTDGGGGWRRRNKTVMNWNPCKREGQEVCE